MIAVAASAVGLPLGMAMPKLHDWYPNSVGWVLVVFLVGAAVTALAILGFEKIAAAGKIASPWMFLVFVAAAVAGVSRRGVPSRGGVSGGAEEAIWASGPAAALSHGHLLH